MPPVANAMSRFRGSGTIGGPKKGRESSAATVDDRLPEMLGGKVLHVHGGSLV